MLFSGGQSTAVLFAALILASVALLLPIPTVQAADPAPDLDPRSPVIDVAGELDHPPAAQRNEPVRARKRRVAPLKPSVTRLERAPAPGRGVASPGSLQAVVREELPPLDGPEPVVPDIGTNDWALQPPTRVRPAPRSVNALPKDAWRGVSMKRFEQISRDYARRPRSRAIRQLWLQVFASNARPPQGAYNDISFEALRMQALYRLGAVREIVKHAATVPRGGRYAVLNILTAKSQIALGVEAAACASAKSLINETGNVAENLQREFVEISVYCALRADDRPRAALMIELARDRGLDAPETFAIIDALTLGRVPALPKGRRLALVPGKLLVLAGHTPNRRFFDIATPALLLALAADPDVAAPVRLEAGEKAAELGALDPAGLRALYLASDRASGNAGARADVMKRIDKLSRTAKDGARTLRDARRLLDSARRTNLYAVIAAMLGPDIRNIPQTGDTRIYAETAVEIATASGQFDAAVGWAIFGSAYTAAGTGGASQGLMHWQMPIDIADTRSNVSRGAGLVPTQDLALRGRFSSAVLHRLVTIFDSLGYIVPIPLWDAASRTPQPAGGYLPKTGLLSDLANAARERQTGHTLLLAIAALGPDGAGKAHLISLGDSLRALRRAGLENAARAIAFEMMFPLWPRQTGR